METDSKNVSSVNFGSKRKQRYSSFPPSGGFGRYWGVVRAAVTFPPLCDCDGVALGFTDSTGATGAALCWCIFCQVNLFPDFVHLYFKMYNLQLAEA